MKLKKLLAAVTAAALAVSTMAVTSFTASAESAIVDSNVIDIGEDIATLGTNLGSVGWGGDIKIENLSEYAAHAGKSYLKVDFTV
ncbi:MAG: hypothetical protein K2K34_03030, partial [Oscillospiraceae bacterium]|nr:hypothetical protein [Oscillospiraceae bacterium]